MKNALLYCVNDNDYQICRMINSINSFAHYNGKLLNELDIYIITDSKIGLNLKHLDTMVKCHVVNDVHYDYSTLRTGYRKNWSFHVYFRWEIFSNPLFWDMDNLLYMDNDTEFTGSVSELFVERDRPQILLVPEKVNHVNQELGSHTIDKYYNSGVMLITPRVMGQDLLQLAFEKLLECAKSRNWKWPNQDPTNVVFGHDPFKKMVSGISSKFNFFDSTTSPCAEKSKAVVLHHVNGEMYVKKFLHQSFSNLYFKDFCERKVPINLHQAVNSPCPLGNAAIIPYKTGYLCAFREFDHYYLTRSFFRYTDRLSSKNELFFALLDQKFNIRSDREKVNNIRIDYGEFKSRDNIIHDPRLFKWDGKLLMSASMFIRPFDRNKFKVGVYEISESGRKVTAKLVHDSRASAGCSRHQKNWMAVPNQPGKMIVQVLPDGVQVMDIFNGRHYSVKSNVDLGFEWNGSTIFRINESRMLALVHRHEPCETGRNYFHRFLVLDNDLKVVHASRGFKFDETFPIEFATSIFQCIDNSEMLGVTVCENDAFQNVYLVNKRRLLDFIGWHGGEFKNVESTQMTQTTNSSGKSEGKQESKRQVSAPVKKSIGKTQIGLFSGIVRNNDTNKFFFG